MFLDVEMGPDPEERKDNLPEMLANLWADEPITLTMEDLLSKVHDHGRKFAWERFLQYQRKGKKRGQPDVLDNETGWDVGVIQPPWKRVKRTK